MKMSLRNGPEATEERRGVTRAAECLSVRKIIISEKVCRSGKNLMPAKAVRPDRRVGNGSIVVHAPMVEAWGWVKNGERVLGLLSAYISSQRNTPGGVADGHSSYI
jgi:hypothetical protein